MRRCILRPFYLLFLFVPAAIVVDGLHLGPTWVFGTSAIAMLPLAWALGEATEELALHTGPRMGAFLNTTLGNLAELIIAIVALRAGLLELVQATITGSIIGNLSLVLGLSLLLGGLKNGVQTFDRRTAGTNATLLSLAVIGLVIPAVFGHAIGSESAAAVEILSLGVAGALMAVYGLSLLFAFGDPTRRAGATAGGGARAAAHHKPRWSKRTSLLVLVVATGLVVWVSELLVAALEEVVVTWGLTELFLGVVLIPLVGNAAEHLVAVEVAVENRMELTLGIAVGSAVQVALLVAPLLVFISLALGHPMTLVFNPFELVALAAGVGVVALISGDGRSNWLEGAMLLAVYVIVALAFFLSPG
ncbi:MAG TPA: calcium/proton exchanger [Anaerolineales bacterium]|nr:calcium/proton exchanger [Anaerolineales bacterium]